jgi:hypothetical protein
MLDSHVAGLGELGVEIGRRRGSETPSSIPSANTEMTAARTTVMATIKIVLTSGETARGSSVESSERSRRTMPHSGSEASRVARSIACQPLDDKRREDSINGEKESEGV